jgi:RNA polymerase sigma factor (sigma-70 family)
MFDVEILTKEEEIQLTALAHAGDHAARDKVIMNVFPLMRKAAAEVGSRYGRVRDIDELAQIGMMHVVQQFHTYDATKARASTYFIPIAKARMKLHVWNRDRTIALPYSAHRPHAKLGTDLMIKANRKMKRTDLDEIDIVDRHVDPSVNQHQIANRIEAATMTLPPSLRSVVEMRLSGMTLGEIGGQLKCSHESVRRTLKSACVALRAMLADIY